MSIHFRHRRRRPVRLNYVVNLVQLLLSLLKRCLAGGMQNRDDATGGNESHADGETHHNPSEQIYEFWIGCHFVEHLIRANS